VFTIAKYAFYRCALETKGSKLEITASNLACQTFTGEDKVLTMIVEN